MSDVVEIVKQMNEACDSGDFENARKLFHPSYTLRGPMMEVNGPEEMVQGMQDAPFLCHGENYNFIEEGNTVVQVFDWVITKPVAYRTRVCDIVVVEDGKIRSEELFFDTANLPSEVREYMQQPSPSGRKAA